MDQVALSKDPEKVIICPACGGSGSVQCKWEEGIEDPKCISFPRRTEERCNCCDGRGWITIGQASSSPFCPKEILAA